MTTKNIKILIATTTSSIIFLIAYSWNFHSTELSLKTSDWGAFGSYLSGTIGLSILATTLYFLFQTTKQQEELLIKQDEIIKLQAEEFQRNESFRATEIAINHYAEINNTFISQHINAELSINNILSKDSKNLSDKAARFLTRPICLKNITKSSLFYTEAILTDLEWLDTGPESLKIKSEVSLFLLEPILGHLNVTIMLIEQSIYAEMHVKNLAREPSPFFRIATLFYKSYASHSHAKKLAKKYIYLNIENDCMESLIPPVRQNSNDEFWKALGMHVAEYENNNQVK